MAAKNKMQTVFSHDNRIIEGNCQEPPETSAQQPSLFQLSPNFASSSNSTGTALDLQSTGREIKLKILLGAKLHKNLGQVVHTYVPLSPSSINWYRPRGGDALRLGW